MIQALKYYFFKEIHASYNLYIYFKFICCIEYYAIELLYFFTRVLISHQVELE